MGESTAKQQDDPVFVAFRRKLADVVTVAINEGKRVSAARPSHGAHCPLGCYPGSPTPRPVEYAAHFFGISSNAAEEFACAFDGDGEGFDGRPLSGPYVDLGRLYRARFP